MSNILIFGDSISRGAFDLEKSGWTSRLTMFCWKTNFQKTGYYYKNIDVNVFAIDGDQTKNILKKFDFQIENFSWNYDKIIFAIGTNDAGFEKGEKRENKKQFAENLQKIIKKAEKLIENKNIYFLGLTNMDSKIIKTDWKESRLQEFDKIIEKVAKENDCQYISLKNLLKNEDLADGLHPNAQGHQKIFERVRKFLKL